MTTKKTKEEPRKLGNVEGTTVYQKKGFLRIQKAKHGAIPKKKLPEDIQRWLTDKWYWTNVYERPKEWLEKHHVNPIMINKLKKFISEHYY